MRSFRPSSVFTLTSFLITIDTEGDNLWSRPRQATTENILFLPRFQELCEQYKLRPTWLVDYDVIHDDRFVGFATDVIARDVGEIGMHPHAWNTPPFDQITEDDRKHQPFLYQYPEDVMREKLSCLQGDLEQRLSVPMLSHRAGRWAMNDTYALMLSELGIQVDCSVTPGVSWNATQGAPGFSPGPDFSRAQSAPYWMTPYSSTVNSGTRLLQVPMTISTRHSGLVTGMNKALAMSRLKLMQRVSNRLFPVHHWLRPNGRNINSMKDLILDTVKRGEPHVEFMLHSSELMPGGSPRFATSYAIERLYEHLNELFDFANDVCEGKTLTEFYDLYHEKVS